jgi:hypothetical protein
MDTAFVALASSKALNAGFWLAHGPQEACVNSSNKTKRCA